MKDRAYVDANVILRFLTKDPPDLASRSRALFKAVEQGTQTLVLDEIILAEVVWVLQSFYGYPAGDIYRVMQDLLVREGIEADDKPGLLDALRLFAEKGVDFADALTAVNMVRHGVREIYSFDTHFDRLPEVARLLPGAA